MAKIRVRTTLDATPAQVWVALSDLASHVTWMQDAVALRFLTDATYGEGARFECDTKVGPLRLTDVMEVTEWVPGKALGVRHVGVVTGTGRFTLQRARGGRTRLSWVEELRFPLWLGGPVGARAAAPVLRRIWRRNLAAFGAQLATSA
jgi:uncharacterized protein YndB with AHSA1/START domain